MNIITALWNRLVRLVRPDVDAIISSFVKAQQKLEDLIDRELAALASEADAIEALIQSRTARNATIDRAYRVVDKLDRLTA